MLRNELIEKIGPLCMTQVETQLKKIESYLGLKTEMQYDEDKYWFIIRNGDRTLLYINKPSLTIQPFELLRIKSLRFFDIYEEETGLAFGNLPFYSNIIQLKTSIPEYLQDYVYYLIIFLIDYFNLEPDDTNVNWSKDRYLIMRSSKYEFVYADDIKKEVEYRKVWNMVNIFPETGEVKMTKIYPTDEYQTLNYKILDMI